jgi:hypothetical protein
MKKIATFVKQRDGQGEGRVFKVNPPMTWHEWNRDRQMTRKTSYVWVSAIDAMFTGAETYIFPCDCHGTVKSFGELDGSFRGEKNIDRALNNAGYIPLYPDRHKKGGKHHGDPPSDNPIPPVEKKKGRFIEKNKEAHK